MKKVSLFALAALAATASSAFAETAPVVVAAPAAPCAAAPCPCPKAFQGFSFGGNIGYGFGASQLSNQQKDQNTAPVIQYGAQDRTFNSSVQGVDGGVLIGYAHRFGKGFLVGLDFYANWGNASGTGSNNVGTPANPAPFLVGKDSFTAKFRNSIDLRAVFGYVINDLVMPKFMLGWENAQWEVSVYERSLNDYGATPKSFNKRLNGFLWGAGVDFLVAKNVVCGLEYTGVALQSMTAKYSRTVAGAGSFTSTTQIKPRAYNKLAMTLKFIY